MSARRRGLGPSAVKRFIVKGARPGEALCRSLQIAAGPAETDASQILLSSAVGWSQRNTLAMGFALDGCFAVLLMPITRVGAFSQAAEVLSLPHVSKPSHHCFLAMRFSPWLTESVARGYHPLCSLPYPPR